MGTRSVYAKREQTRLSDEMLDRESLFADCDAVVRDQELDADLNDDWPDDFDHWPNRTVISHYY